MATAQTVSKLFSRFFIKSYDHDPDSTSATAVEWVAAKGFENFGFIAMASALTGTGISAMSIQAATAAAGTNNTIIKSHAVGSAADAVGDCLTLECTAEEIAAVGRAAGYAFTHVSLVITFGNNAADENVVTYIWEGNRQYDALTADVIA